MIDFDESIHAYKLDGRPVLSVTQILREAGLIDTTHYTEYARDRGTYVAQATQFYDEGDLDFSGLAPELLPYVLQWQKFIEWSGAEVLSIEERVANTTYLYAGTLDRRIRMRGDEYVLDIKTGEPEPWHSLQTGAYSATFIERKKRCAVYLSPDRFRWNSHNDPRDVNVFLAAASIANWKLNNGVSLWQQQQQKPQQEQ